MSTKYVLITGASGGLGKSLAEIFAHKGYNLILTARNKSALECINAYSIPRNIQSLIVEGDLRDSEVITQLAREANQVNLEILINNAAINIRKNFEEAEDFEIDEILGTNLIAPMKLTRAIYPIFLRNKQGTIVNINSMDVLKITSDSKTLYAPTKFGLRGFTDSLRYEAKPRGIRVIGIYIGGMKTSMFSTPSGDPDKLIQPNEAAEVIFDACKSYKSVCAEEIFLGRTIY